MTDQDRPKLLILNGPHVDLRAIADSLGSTYEIVTGTPGQGIEEGQFEAVFAAAGSLVGLEGQDLVTRQSALLLDAISEGICLADDTGSVVWCNKRFRGYHPSVQRRIAAVCRHAFTRLTKMRTEGRGIRSSRYSVSVRDGNRNLEIQVSPVVEGQGKPRKATEPPTLVAAVARDVTNRRRTQEKINAIDRVGRELVCIAPEQVKKMHASERLGVLEERVARASHELLHFDHFAVRLLNPQTNELELVMSAGLPSAATEITLYAEREGNGISGYVAATGEPYICVDASKDDKYVFGLEQAGSSLTIPLMLFGKVMGIFDVESDRVGAFNEQDRQFAEIFGRYLTMALHILNLLVVERFTTRQSAHVVVEDEIAGPLEDLIRDAKLLRERSGDDSEAAAAIDRIFEDVESIQRRLKNVSEGPASLLGIEDAIRKRSVDPILAGRNVLVADNEESIRETVSELLRARGARVVLCNDGDSAIQLLDQWAVSFDADEAFDLVISDINLGDRTGYDVFAAAKRASAELPVILMTGFGYDPHHSIVRASQEGLQCVLFKPFQAEAMITEAKKAIEGEASEDA